MSYIDQDQEIAQSSSPFLPQERIPLASTKFSDRFYTNSGDRRASVSLSYLETLWFNTGTLCNLSCKNCYIESTPTNDALVYITQADVLERLDEIAQHGLPTREIGFTGGEPFMNREMVPIIQACLDRGYDVLVLTNAMRPMRRFERELLALDGKDRLTFRVSLDHHTAQIHEMERGAGAWAPAISGLVWLAQNGFQVSVAGRHLADEDEGAARAGYQRLFAAHDLAIDAHDRARLVLFPELDAAADITEISTGCWDTLGVDPSTMMCASSRMVVKRKGEPTTRFVACTLLPYEEDFDMGVTLSEALRDVHLNHPHCARFCVLGGASCTA